VAETYCTAQDSIPEAQGIMNEACKAADPGGAIFAASTAAWAIYAFLKTPSDFWRTIFACIEVGGKQALGMFSSRQQQHTTQQHQNLFNSLIGHSQAFHRLAT
jgi:hypothetical protein